MDIPLSSTALDLALHPSPNNDLLVVGLISGKVELLNLSEQSGDGEQVMKQRLKKKQKRMKEPEDEGDEDDAESSADGSRSYAKKWSTRYKSKSCRGVEFNWDGSQIWCLSKDKTLYSLDTSTGQVSSTYADAHSAAPSRLLPLPGQTDPHLLVTGDDDGVVKLWDTRLRTSKGSSSGTEASTSSVKAVREYSHHFDWITDLHFSSHLIPPKMSKADREKKLKEQKEREEKKRKRKFKQQNRRGAAEDSSSEEDDDDTAIQRQSGRERLICTSGDGTLSVIDFRAGSSSSSSTESKKKRDPHQAIGVEVSEDQEDELLSLTSVKNGSKLIVGTQLGLLSLWSPNKGMLDHIDRIPGHPSSIDCLLNLDEDTVLTGSSDGLIRVVQILPHKFLGVVADHGQGLPVERMKRKGGMLVSCGHGSEVKVTDISSLLEDGDDSDEDDEGNEEDAEAMARRLGGAEVDSDDSEEDEEEDDVKNIGDISGPLRSGEEDDDDDAEADSDDDSSEEEEPPPRPLTKKEKRKLQTLSAGGEDKVTHDREDFFADL